MQKVVLVTGASTGIGADTVRCLIEKSFTVVATVRKDEDEKSLISLYGNKVKVIKLDVSNLSAIEKVPEILKEKFQITKLDGLVNNAGVALAGPFAFQDFAEVQNIIQINVLSVMKMTQVLIPMLRSETPGRIVNVSSISGKNAAPFLSVYAASKHAIEGFSEALRKEMLIFGIKVVVVAPGSIKTPIWQKGFVLIKDRYAQTVFADSFAKFVRFAASAEKYALEVSAVSEVICKALTVDDPCVRYAPTPKKFVNLFLPKIIPIKIYDKLTAKALGLVNSQAKIS
jgi:short-subunit dehydrogenase